MGKKAKKYDLDTLEKELILAVGPEGGSEEVVKAKTFIIYNLLKSLENEMKRKGGESC